jgi:hypothetical protein
MMGEEGNKDSYHEGHQGTQRKRKKLFLGLPRERWYKTTENNYWGKGDQGAGDQGIR